MSDWIQTYTGKQFEFERPTLDMLDIEDIAHALSGTARYNHHTRDFYSVAQHACIVASCAPREIALAALLHDAAEAYTGDMVSPLKRMCPDFKRVEKVIEALVCEKFGVDIHDARIKELDMRILINEKRDLFVVQRNWKVEETYAPLPIGTIVAQPPREAKMNFLNAFVALGGKL